MQTPGDDFLSYQQKAAHFLSRRIRKYEFVAIEELLNSDYNIDGRVSDTGMSALSLACSLGEKTEAHKPYNKKLIGTILKYNPNINHKDDWGRTPLHMACNSGNLTAVKTLIEIGVSLNDEPVPYNLDLNAQSIGGETALMKACQ